MFGLRRGHVRAWLCRTLLLATLVAIPGNAVAKRNGSFSGAASITKDTLLHIESRRGDIVIRSGTGNVVQVTAHLRNSSDQGDTAGRYTAAEIIAYLERHPPIIQDGDKVRIGAMLDEDFHLGVDISYDIVAPAWTSLKIESEVGELQIFGVGTHIGIRKTAGPIRIQEPYGKVRVECVDSPVQVFGKPLDEWSLESKSGNIDVVVPEDLAFELDAESKAGRLESEFPLGEHQAGRFEGILNGAGPRIHIRTELGAIAVWQR